MADAAPPIHARALTRAFAGVPVVAGIDLTVGAGDVVVLLGPNGAGKTTLLRMLALLVRPTEGELALFGTGGRVADRVPNAHAGLGQRLRPCGRRPPDPAERTVSALLSARSSPTNNCKRRNDS